MIAMCIVLIVSTNMGTHFPPSSMLGFGLGTLQRAANTYLAWRCLSFLTYFKSFYPEPLLQDLYTHWNNFHFSMEE